MQTIHQVRREKDRRRRALGTAKTREHHGNGNGKATYSRTVAESWMAHRTRPAAIVVVQLETFGRNEEIRLRGLAPVEASTTQLDTYGSSSASAGLAPVEASTMQLDTYGSSSASAGLAPVEASTMQLDTYGSSSASAGLARWKRRLCS